MACTLGDRSLQAAQKTIMATWSGHPFAEPKVKCSAVWLMVLALPIALAGNPFLALCGCITAGLVLVSQRAVGSDGAEPVAALSIVTVALAVFYAAVIASSGFYTLIMAQNPHFTHRACKVSTDWVARYNSSATVGETAGGVSFFYADGVSQPPLSPPPPPPPPDAEEETVEEEAASSLAMLESLQRLLCGEGAPGVLTILGAMILAFGLLVALPFAMHALALGSAARRAGGFACCSPQPPPLVIGRPRTTSPNAPRSAIPVAVARPIAHGVVADPRQMY